MKTEDGMRAEYDFTGAERGRLARKYGRGVTLLVLDPEVTRAFGDADTAGRVLKALAGVLTRCRALVTNDSGAMHLAAALGVPVTAVFGPTNEHATAPIGGDHVVVTYPVWCRPCMLRECPLDHRCMRGIEVGPVIDAARRTLR